MDNESLEVNARTVDDAIAKAAQQLGRARDELEITVLSEGRGGILGIGAEDAHILVSVKASVAAPPPAPAAVAADDGADAEPAAGRPPRSRSRGRGGRGAAGAAAATLRARDADSGEEGEEGSRRAIVLDDEQASEAKAILLDLLDLLGMDTDVEIHRRDGSLVFEVVGEDLGLLIGRRGETLTALQFTLNLVLAKRFKKWARVVVDVEGYRGRREQTLHGLAQRIAYRVEQTGQPVALEAMPAGERRIIHLALAENPNVSTGSVGEGDHRKVVVSPRRG